MPEQTRPEPFHDYLRLAQRRFRDHRLVLFHGESGSGKSTAIQWLLRFHEDFRGSDWQVVDEVRVLSDLPLIWRALRAGGRALVATHVGPRWYAAFRAFGPQSRFELDSNSGKITHWLAQRGVSASPAAIASFCREYGANYIDARIVLEHDGGPDFDRALARFRRDCRLEHGPACATRPAA